MIAFNSVSAYAVAITGLLLTMACPADGYGGKNDPARITLDLEDEDYEAESILAVRYRSNAKNEDGLTCFDILYAAASVSVMPPSLRPCIY